MCEDCGLPIDSFEVAGGKIGRRWVNATGHICPAQLGTGGLGTLRGKFGNSKKIQRVPNGFGCTKCGFTSELSHIVHRHLSVMHSSLLCPVEGEF